VNVLLDEDAARGWLRNTLGCDDAAMARLAEFVEMLRAENARQNLVSAASLDQVWCRHIADSAQLLDVSRGTWGRWLDLGTGAGFPGLIVALLDPTREVVMVESRARRVAWLQEIIHRCQLTNAAVIGERLETVPTFAAAIISARAFAPLNRLIALAARFSTSETRWLLPKGKNGAKELGEMPKPIKEMFHVEPSITDPQSVILVGQGCVSITKASQ
jgi:16S rRNA (guanine527-N7)-methyltransferase